MNIYGRVKGHDFWILVAKGKTVADYNAYLATEHKWSEVHAGPLAEGQQTIGQKLGYAG